MAFVVCNLFRGTKAPYHDHYATCKSLRTCSSNQAGGLSLNAKSRMTRKNALDSVAVTKTADLSLAGRILKEAREKLNLRLEDFALALSKEGVVGPTGTPYSLGTVSRWLAGQVEPPFNVIATAARLAGVSIDQHIRADAPGEIETTPDQVRRSVREALGETN